MLYSDGYVQEGNWVNDILTTDNNSIAKYIKRKFYFKSDNFSHSG